MKQKYQKYFATGLTAFLVIGASIALFFIFFHLKGLTAVIRNIFSILEPFVVGAMIAYILSPLYNLLIRNLAEWLGKIMKPRRARKLASGISVLLSVACALLVVYGMIALVVPRFVSSILVIVNSLQTYTDEVVSWVTNLFKDNPSVAASITSAYESATNAIVQWFNTEFATDIASIRDAFGSVGSILGAVLTGVRQVVRVVNDIVIGLVVAVYLLVGKKHLLAQTKKIVYSCLKLRPANFIVYMARYVHRVFGDFIRGKIVDSLIIGVLCFAGCSLLRIPYPLVVSVIVGVTNIIPFFGPIIGAVPCGVFILLVSPIKCLYFVIFVFLLQQFDGNILGPKILGNSTGLSSFWVLFSILLFGGLFGFVGMIICVPLFAVIYTLVSSLVNHALSKKGLSLDTNAYFNLDRIDQNDNTYIHMKDPMEK